MPIEVGREAEKYVQEFNTANPEICVKHRDHMVTGETERPRGCVVIHVDAGCYDEGCMAMGMVISDSNMNVILSSCSRRNISVEPDLAEAMAIEWGLATALKLNYHSIVLQSDAKGVVDCINGLEENVNIGPVVMDCKVLLKQFECFSVIFCNRSFNKDAHNLVGIGRQLGSRTWLNVIPPVDVDLFPTSVSV